MALDIKFNIYHSRSINGPWTQSNDSPIDLSSDGNQSYIVPRLNGETNYFFRIVGGHYQGNEFFPLFSQVIGNNSTGAVTSLESQLLPSPLQLITASGIASVDLGSLGHAFEVV